MISDERLAELAEWADRRQRINDEFIAADLVADGSRRHVAETYRDTAAALRMVLAVRELLKRPQVPVMSKRGEVIAWFAGASTEELLALLAAPDTGGE